MIRVVVVDASLPDRAVVREILSADPEISVVGTTGGGSAALDLVFRIRPQVVTLALDAAVAESHQFVQQIMAHCPTPILLLAEPGQSRGDQVAQILAAGALDVTEKPRLARDDRSAGGRWELPVTVKLLARVPVITHVQGKLSPLGRQLSLRRRAAARPAAVAVVSSTGGPMALTRLLSGLPAGMPVSLLVVQHMAEGFMEGLACWFQEHCCLPVRVASPGEVAKPGLVLLAPDGRQMTVGKDAVIELKRSSVSGVVRPSGDRLFQSVANVYGPGAIGVVLTGMGNDGSVGAASIKAAGGRVIVQDETTSTIFGMPKATVEAGAVDEVLPIDAIAGKLVQWIGN